MIRALFLAGALALGGGAAQAQWVSPPAQTVRDFQSFGGRCDGTTDNATAFASAVSWLSSAANREVRLPASVCATSATVTLGDGRQQNTTLTVNKTGVGTTATVASCTGVQAGDNLVIVRDDGTTYSNGAVVSCVGTTLTHSVAYSGGQASSGKPVYTGKPSTYHGGGFVGFGSGAIAAAITGGVSISAIKYTGSAAPTTTLTATPGANATTLTVASTANMTLGAPLGITLDNGRVWWTSIDYIASATSVVVVNEMPSTATSGNTVTIASNPVFKIAGAMIDPVLKGVHLDANSLAAIGLDIQHTIRGDFRGNSGILTTNYTGIGMFAHGTRVYLGTFSGFADNDIEPYAMNPANNKTIGCWLLGGGGPASSSFDVAFSRNRFQGGNCTMGGNDVTAAAIREEYTDNNTWIRPFTQTNLVTGDALGAGLYRQPSHARTGFPGGNIWIGPSFASTGVTDGTDVGGSVVGTNSYFGWNTESSAFPATKAVGSNDVGDLVARNLTFLSGGILAGNIKGTAGQTMAFGVAALTGTGAPTGTAEIVSIANSTGGVFETKVANNADASGANLVNLLSLWNTNTAGQKQMAALNIRSEGPTANQRGGTLTLQTKIDSAGGVADVWGVDYKRHQRVYGSAPALTSCGTGSPTIVGSDLAGTVTMGTNATGCVITFNIAYAAAPICTVTWQNTPLASQSYVIAADKITLTQTSTSGNKANYVCFAQSGG